MTKLSPRQVSDIWPLLPMQESLLLYSESIAKSRDYYGKFCFILSGDLDKAHFDQAWDIVVQRHEMLRVVFRWKETKQPVQLVLQEYERPVQHLDYSQEPADEKELIEQLLNRTVIVSPEDSCFQVVLAKLAASRYAMCLYNHHAVFDGWSLNIIIRDFFRAYFKGADPDEGAVHKRICFKAFIDYYWKLPLQPQRQFWQDNLEGVSSCLLQEINFNADYEDDGSSRKLTFVLDPGLAGDLRRLAGETTVTISSVLFSAWAKLLQGYTGQDDVVFGTTLSIRDERVIDIDNSVGLYINTVPFRLKSEDCTTVRQAIMTMNDATEDMRKNALLPLDEIVKTKTSPGEPLFNTLFVVENYPVETSIKDGDTLHVAKIAYQEQNNFDLSVIVQYSDLLQVTILYRSGLFSNGFIGRLATVYQQILQAFSEDPDQRLHSMGILSPQDNQLLLRQGSGQTVPIPSQTVDDIFFTRAAATPEAIALCDVGDSMRYGEVAQAVERWAAFLAERGVRPGLVVAVYCKRSCKLVMAVLAILSAGGVYLPLRLDDPSPRLRYFMDDSGAEFLLTDDPERAARFCGPGIHIFDLAWSVAPEAMHSRLAAGHGPEDPCYIIYTSGSTGNPKGVLVCHRAVVNRIQWMQGEYALTPLDRILQKTPCTFDVSVWELMWWFFSGCTCYLLPQGGEKDPAVILQWINEHAITVLHFVPSMLELFLEYVRSHPELVNRGRALLVFSSGEALMAHHVRAFYDAFGAGARLVNLYGPTEATVDVSYAACRSDSSGIVPIGRPIDNIRLYVLDHHRNLVPSCVAGELYIAGAGVAQGYANQPELTARFFTADPYQENARMYKTGDQAAWSEDGKLYYLGRRDKQVKIHGIRVELGEIENAIASCRGVRGLALEQVEFQQNGRTLAAFIVLDEEGSIETIRQMLSDRLSGFMIPGFIIPVESILLTLNGKTDSRAMLERYADRIKRRSDAPPSPFGYDPVSVAVKYAVEEVLTVPVCRERDSFYDLGGDSLSAVRIVNQIGKSLDMEVPVSLLLSNPIIVDFIEAICARRQPDRRLAPITPCFSGDGLYDASPQQKRLYLLHELCNRDTRYNMSISFRINGKLDRDGFHLAIDRLVERHESLRTSFVYRDGVLRQRVHEPFSLTIEQYRLHDDSEEAVQSVIRQFDRPFCLNEAPLFRVGMAEISCDQCLLMFSMHHIIADGISAKILIRDFTAFYNGDQLEPLAVSYKDYVPWHLAFLDSDGYKRQMKYWVQRYAGDIPLLAMPTDFNRPSVHTGRGCQAAMELPAADLQALHAFARANDCSLFMVLLTVYYSLLWRYTGQENLVVGTPVALRRQAETETMVGVFINTLSLRVNLKPEESLRHLLSRVKKTVLEAFDCQDAHFESLVEAVASQRDPSRNPLFDTMFVLQPTDMKTFTLRDLSVELIKSQTLSSQVDFSLIAEERDSSLFLQLEYCPDLFFNDSMEVFLHRYVQLIRTCPKNPEAALSELPFWLPGEKNRLGAGISLRPEYQPEIPLLDRFLDTADRDPSRIAVIGEDETLTYEELDRRSNHLALYLRQCGIGPNCPVLVYALRTSWAVVCFVSIWKAGGACVFLDTLHMPAQRVKRIADSLRVTVLLSDLPQQNLKGIAGEGCRVVTRGRIPGSLAKSNRRFGLGAGPDDIAYIVYTSGSTGMPKGIVVQHRQLMNMTSVWKQEYPLDNAVLLQVAGFSFDVFIGDVMRSIFSAGTMVLCGDDHRLDLPWMAAAIERYAVTVFEATPTLAVSLLDYMYDIGQPADSLSMIVIGSDVCMVDDYRRILGRYGEKARVINSYGVSEATIDTSYYEEKPGQPNPLVIRSLPIGKPMATCTMAVCDLNGNPLPSGITGELYIGGSSVAKGYWELPDLTTQRFIETPDGRLYRTGDMARWLPDGNLLFLGRKDFQIKIRGFRIEIEEIERVIASHPKVGTAAVFCRGTSSDTLFLNAALVKDSDDLDLDDVQNYVRANLPSYMIPVQYYVVDSMPLNANGKKDRKQLACLLPNNSFTPASQPVTEEEGELIQLWQDILSMQDIGPDDSFFEIGGNSALVLQLFTRLQDRYKSLQISDLFSYHTPRMFIQCMQSRRAEPPEALPEKKQENAYETLLENMLSGNMDKARGMDAIKERGLNG